jgi:hypothetical protein
MAATVTLTATSLEGQVLEAASALQAAEASMPTETRKNFITITPNPDGGFVQIVANLPATMVTAAGGLRLTADPYVI